MKLADSIKQGLREAIEYERGNLCVRRRVVQVKGVPKYEAKNIKQIRLKANLSQASLARVIGVSTKTVEAWERGRNIPSGPAQRLLYLIDKEPEIIKKYILD